MEHMNTLTPCGKIKEFLKGTAGDLYY